LNFFRTNEILISYC